MNVPVAARRHRLKIEPLCCPLSLEDEGRHVCQEGMHRIVGVAQQARVEAGRIDGFKSRFDEDPSARVTDAREVAPQPLRLLHSATSSLET